MIIFATKMINMKKYIYLLLSVTVLYSSCAQEFNRVFKTDNVMYKYEYAKEAILSGKYIRAITLLEPVITLQKGTKYAEESLFLLGLSYFHNKDYELAAQTFKKYSETYPRGTFIEMAFFYVGESLFMSTPEPRLDQSETIAAIAAFQAYLDVFPSAKYKKTAQQRLFELQDKLVKKEYYSAKLYYDLGTYFGNCTTGGNNYEACIITAQNAIKTYPYTTLRESFALLIIKSKFELAEQSVEEKKVERFRDAEDECYAFINEFPDSKNKELANRFIKKCQKITKTAPQS